MTQLYSNNAIARITVPLYTGGMVIQIDPARAPLFPNPQRIEEYFLITLDDINDPDVYEIVKISSRSGSTLNVAARGYEGTTERSWTVADTICDHRITAGTLPPEPEPTKKGHGGWTGYRSEFDTSDEQKFDTSKLEHLYVTITTVFDGETVVTTWDNSPTDIRPLISINKLTSTQSDVQVTVNNLLLGKEE